MGRTGFPGHTLQSLEGVMQPPFPPPPMLDGAVSQAHSHFMVLVSSSAQIVWGSRTYQNIPAASGGHCLGVPFAGSRVCVSVASKVGGVSSMPYGMSCGCSAGPT